MEQRELEDRYFRDVQITKSADLSWEMRDLKTWNKEVFVAFYLDTSNYVLSREIIAIGILDATIVHPREVFRTAIVRNAKSVIIAHNHPSGQDSPSEEDRQLTARLKEAGDVLCIRLLDHVIVTQHGHYSFADAGDL